MLIKFATLQPDLISKAPLEASHFETYHIDEHIPYLRGAILHKTCLALFVWPNFGQYPTSWESLRYKISTVIV